MIQQANLSRKTIVTKFTFERLFLLMNHTNMYIQVTFFRTLFVTKFTFKMLLFFMNRSNMVQQATLSRKTIVTKLFKEKGSLNRHMESIHEGKNI